MLFTLLLLLYTKTLVIPLDNNQHLQPPFYFKNPPSRPQLINVIKEVVETISYRKTSDTVYDTVPLPINSSQLASTQESQQPTTPIQSKVNQSRVSLVVIIHIDNVTY